MRKTIEGLSVLAATPTKNNVSALKRGERSTHEHNRHNVTGIWLVSSNLNRILAESASASTVFSPHSCAIRFIATMEIASVIGVHDMSAKWRRSRRFLKWIDPGKTPITKAQRVHTFRPPHGMHFRKYHLPRKFAKENLKEPQPLIDVFQEKTWVTVIAEIAGFNKETLKIDVKDQKLTLSAKAKDRRYYKTLNLPKEVIPNIIHTNYKNGVLEIKLKKAYKQETIKKHVG
jgi:HSP20 family molecular chaperone IbpA